MNTPGRRQEVVIKGISMSIGSMVAFFFKMAVAAIPAIFLLFLTVIPAAAILRKWVEEQGLETISKRAGVNTKFGAMRSDLASTMPPARLPMWTPENVEARLANDLYLIAFDNCADSARKLFGLGKRRRITNASDGPHEIREKVKILGASHKWYGATMTFSCDVSRYGSAVAITDVQRIAR